MQSIIKLYKCYQSNEYCEMPESINITLFTEAEEKLSKVAELIKTFPIKIENINIDSNEIFDADYNEFEEAEFRIGNSYVKVFNDKSWYFIVQDKYDSSSEAEYSITEC